MPKQSNDLSRKGERKQRTKKGLVIPVPTTEEFDDLLRKSAATKKTATRKKK